MAHKQFIKQLRTDSFYNILLATPLLTMLLSIVSHLIGRDQGNNLANFWWLIIHLLFSPGISYLAWRLASQERQHLATQLFLGGHLLLIALNLGLAEPHTMTFLPYLFGYFIVISSTLVRPEASFNTWLLSLVVYGAALLYHDLALPELVKLLPPMVANLFLAVASWLTTLDWREAIQNTSLLQQRAQQRRDELFTVQEELKRANYRQRALYRQLITSVEVGQRITTLIDLDELLGQVVTLIKTQLEFAYVGIFLFENNDSLVSRAEASDGPAIRPDRPRIFIDQKNILSLTAAQRQDVIVADIRQSQFETHPYHSVNTLSEVGLPLLVGDQLHGVLNMQSYGVDAFTAENLPILRSLANQVAIALHNAQLFTAADVARHQAEQANEIKSHFLASMSHELRTPLNAILNFTGFVADGVFGPINADQADALEKTLDSGTHLLSLINDILDLAKVEAGAMEMFVQEVDISSLLKSTAATAGGLLKNKPVELIVQIEDPLSHIMGDKRRIRQIFLNLVSNAVKYTRTGQITIAARQQQDHLQVFVRDTGIGIAPEDQPLIFETFHQAENGVYNELGTGLGLPIAKYFVEAHGGQIWLESALGHGATFYVTLPLTPTPETRPLALSARPLE
jgi:signal transduction histidine kinase